MKKLYFLFSLWPLFVLGQVSTGFEIGLGGEWDQFPVNRWESSPEQALSGLYSLHHSFDNTAGGRDNISLKTGILDNRSDICWEFTLRHGYTSSSTNKWQVFLATDKSASESGNSEVSNGYVFGVNSNGSDDSLRIYAIKEGKLFRLCTTSINFENDIGTAIFHCRIIRNSLRKWEIYASKENSDLQNIAAFQEPEIDLPPLRHFLLSYSYSSSKDQLLWFDDLSIQGNILVDTISPEISGFTIPDRRSIILEFSEEIESTGFKKTQILLNPGNIVPEKINVTGRKIFCYFNEEFIQKTNYQLNTTDFADKEGNLSESDSIEFIYYEAEKNDLVFTEIMADPIPVVYLPEQEYIELFNRCEYPINLDSFTLVTDTKKWLLPDVIIFPGNFLVFSDGSITNSTVIPLFTSSSSITNDGQQISLINKQGKIITVSEFNSDWYQDDFKSQGGWSLERIDANNLCGGKENWKASENATGGTPGSQNSVQAINHDLAKPFIERLEFINENKIRLIFSEYIDPITIPNLNSFSLLPGMIIADSLFYRENFCNYLEIGFNEKFHKGDYYNLNMPDGIKDCSGNNLQFNDPIRFGLPSPASFTDLIISEVLYSSLLGCPEYLEIYNISESLLDLSDIRIVVTQEEVSGIPVIPLNIHVLIFPGEYFVLCKDKLSLLSCHVIADPTRILEVMDLPSLPDNGSCIRLYNKSLETVDIFCYKPGDTFPMLSDTHGISLERLLLDRKTGDQSYWHSASTLSGFGTPGEKNSQSLSGISPKSTLDISPEIFSPDNDGKNDILEIHYSIKSEGFVGTIAVFDPSGFLVCFLGENEILGTSGMLLWDGKDDIGTLCNTGLYIIYFEMWNLKGEKERFKKTVVLVRH